MLEIQHYLCPGYLFCGINRGGVNVGSSLFLYLANKIKLEFLRSKNLPNNHEVVVSRSGDSFDSSYLNLPLITS